MTDDICIRVIIGAYASSGDRGQKCKRLRSEGLGLTNNNVASKDTATGNGHLESLRLVILHKNATSVGATDDLYHCNNNFLRLRPCCRLGLTSGNALRMRFVLNEPSGSKRMICKRYSLPMHPHWYRWNSGR